MESVPRELGSSDLAIGLLCGQLGGLSVGEKPLKKPNSDVENGEEEPLKDEGFSILWT